MNRDDVLELLIGISEHDEEFPVDESVGTWSAQLFDVSPAEAQLAVGDWFAEAQGRRITPEDVLASVRAQRGPVDAGVSPDPWDEQRAAEWHGGDGLAALRGAAEARACPYCGQLAGSPCVNKITGKPTKIPHLLRTVNDRVSV